MVMLLGVVVVVAHQWHIAITIAVVIISIHLLLIVFLRLTGHLLLKIMGRHLARLDYTRARS